MLHSYREFCSSLPRRPENQTTLYVSNQIVCAKCSGIQPRTYLYIEIHLCTAAQVREIASCFLFFAGEPSGHEDTVCTFLLELQLKVHSGPTPVREHEAQSVISMCSLHVQQRAAPPPKPYANPYSHPNPYPNPLSSPKLDPTPYPFPHPHPHPYPNPYRNLYPNTNSYTNTNLYPKPSLIPNPYPNTNLCTYPNYNASPSLNHTLLLSRTLTLICILISTLSLTRFLTLARARILICTPQLTRTLNSAHSLP